MWAPAAAYLPLGRAGLALILISCSARHFSDTCWSQVLSTTEALEGLVAPAAAYVLLGRAGPVLIITICFMVVISRGASKMVAISSPFTFDVYCKYINPKVSLQIFNKSNFFPSQHILICATNLRW